MAYRERTIVCTICTAVQMLSSPTLTVRYFFGELLWRHDDYCRNCIKIKVIKILESFENIPSIQFLLYSKTKRYHVLTCQKNKYSIPNTVGKFKKLLSSNYLICGKIRRYLIISFDIFVSRKLLFFIQTITHIHLISSVFSSWFNLNLKSS